MNNKKKSIDEMVEIIRNAASEYFININGSDKIQNPDDAIKYLEAALFDKGKENFGVIFLTTQNYIIDFKIISTGSINSTEINLRNLAKDILDRNAGAFIVCHNHPSGNTKESLEDVRLYKNLKKFAQYLDCQLLDFIIVGNPGNFNSLKRRF